MDLSLIIDWVIQELKKLSGSTILSVISIFIAFNVFRFNKKMGHSKLSVSPSLKLYDVNSKEQSADPTYELAKYNWIWYDPVVGLPIRLLERIDRDLDRNVPFDNRFIPQTLCVKLKNKGELASANIKITLLFKAYGTKIQYSRNSTDEFDYSSLKRKLFSQKKVVIKVPYMGADDEKEFQIVDLKGQFREAELILCSIKANGHTYFREKRLAKFFNRVVISHYFHPYLEGESDMADINALIGLGQGYTNTKWEDPYKRIGGLKWLRKLYVGWRK
ncbi:hypothetical protein [Exiguobacterium sp. s100]|uniref:hypothetical protein n=3 Tax=unclassified Exiguobacterium TaxID=2644629 RepID=UPI001BEA7134|nr:hypothetical protein [Exiguobacterium sp. s100]